MQWIELKTKRHSQKERGGVAAIDCTLILRNILEEFTVLYITRQWPVVLLVKVFWKQGTVFRIEEGSVLEGGLQGLSSIGK